MPYKRKYGIFGESKFILNSKIYIPWNWEITLDEVLWHPDETKLLRSFLSCALNISNSLATEMHSPLFSLNMFKVLLHLQDLPWVLACVCVWWGVSGELFFQLANPILTCCSFELLWHNYLFHLVCTDLMLSFVFIYLLMNILFSQLDVKLIVKDHIMVYRSSSSGSMPSTWSSPNNSLLVVIALNSMKIT